MVTAERVPWFRRIGTSVDTVAVPGRVFRFAGATTYVPLCGHI